MRNLVLLTAITFILFMSRGITGPIGSLYAESLGASYVAIGLLGTVTSLCAILFSTVWGRASDRLGRRKVFLVPSLAVTAVAYGLMAGVPRYEYLFPLHALGAIAQAAYNVASLALMGDLLEGRAGERGRRIGTYRGLGSLGFGLMAFISGSIADRLSLRVPFGLAGSFLAVACLLALWIKDPAPARNRVLGKSPVSTDTHAEPAHRLPIAPLLISAFLWSLSIGAVYAVWANYMVSGLGYSQTALGRLWALASMSELPFMMLAGRLSDRMGRLPMLGLGFLTWSLVFAGYVVAPGMPWIVAIQLVRGFAYSAYAATAMTYATEVRSRSQRGLASGLYGSAEGAGSILGSSMGGTLAQFTGFQAMIGTNAALVFGGAVYLGVEAVRWGRRGEHHG
jgi:MFS family permease